MSWGLWGLRIAADDVYHQIDEWGNHARDGHWDYADPDVDDHMNGNCWDWAIAHQRQNPHLRIGQEWRWQEPDEREEPEDEWEAIHAFTHDDHWAYDVRGAFPLSEWRKWKGWDDVTFNHEPWEIGGGRYGQERPLYPPLEELVSRNKPRPPLPDRTAMAVLPEGHHGPAEPTYDPWDAHWHDPSLNSRAPRRAAWYHVTPHKMKPGDVLMPGGGDSLYDDGGFYGDSNQGRKRWVWIEHDPDKVEHWMEDLFTTHIRSYHTHPVDWPEDEKGEDEPPLYVYRIQPHHPPQPWDNTAGQGWVTGAATVLGEEMRETGSYFDRVRTKRKKKRNARLTTAHEDEDGDGVYDRMRRDGLIKRLEREYHAWYGENGNEGLDYSGRGPLGNWRNIENFMKDKYPAAHRGLNAGQESVMPLLDFGSRVLSPLNGREDTTAPYETGSDAIRQHGYDPKEVAAAMLLLHNRTHPHRSDLEYYDTDRLVGIARSRSRMQQDYEQRNARLAAVTQGLVDRLHDEFHDWYDQNKDELFFQVPNNNGQGPLGHWPNIESFLADRYPAANKGHEMGMEEAARGLDGLSPMPYQLRGHADLTPYDTGPEAVERHGYDPAEVAASMLLLHNRSHPLRGDMEQRDVDRLTGIVQKRHQMQRDYENRTAARPNPRLRLEVEHHDDEYGGKTVSAHDGDGDRPIAYLRTSLNPDGLEYIDMIHVDDRYKRLGVGRTIWEHAGRPMHAPEDQRSWEGLAWSKAVGGDSVDRTGAVKTATPFGSGPPDDDDDGHRIAAQSRDLYRGLKGIRFPYRIRDMIDQNHPGLADAVLEYVSDAQNPHKGHPSDGLGIHWSVNPSVAHSFGGNYVNSEPNGVWMRAEWGGRGRRRIPEDDVIPSEQEWQLHPGTPLRVRELGLSVPGGYHDENGDWQDRSDDWFYLPVDRQMHASRLAMPAPMPGGVTFHYHPTNATIPTEPWVADPNLQVGLFSAPAVEARHDGRHIGHLGWDSDPDDEGDPTPVVSMIKVHPDYRRHGIGTALWDFARRHEPDLQHSDIRTELGELWVNHERNRLARLAMAWDQWAPRIEGGCANGCDHSRGMMGEYSIGHPDGSGPKPGDLMPGLKGRSVLHFTHDTGSDGTPELYVSGVHTDENHRRDGVAEALMRRLHQDHPGTRINPGFMTDMGEGLKDGLVNRIPGAQDVLAGDQRKAALDLRFFLGLDWHSHDDDQQRIQVKDKIPADPSWLEATDENWYNPAEWWNSEEQGEMTEDDFQRAVSSPDYDPAPSYRSNPPSPPPHQQRWYHVSPYQMRAGDHVIPGKNPSFDSERGVYTVPGGDPSSEDEWENPLGLPGYDNHTRRHWVWMAPKLRPTEEEMGNHPPHERPKSRYWGNEEHASLWANRLRMPRNRGKMYVYEVRPTEHPKPWNLNPGQGWTAPSARVVREVPEHEWNPWPDLRMSRLAALPEGHQGPAEPNYDGGNDFYAEFDDDIAKAPDGATWYHVSPHDLPSGAVLAPGGGDSPFPNFYDDPGLMNRSRWVWMEHQLHEAQGWREEMGRAGHPGPLHVYQVTPSHHPKPWNGTAQQGWAAPTATVVGRVPEGHVSRAVAERRALEQQKRRDYIRQMEEYLGRR
jgi:ribosomal protein S18 acetylase RimI-like enzyme